MIYFLQGKKKEREKRKQKNYIQTIMNLYYFRHSTKQSPVQLNDLSNWPRLSSLQPLLYGTFLYDTGCCFIEFASLIGSQFDFDRYVLASGSGHGQVDIILITGTVTKKMEPNSHVLNQLDYFNSSGHIFVDPNYKSLKLGPLLGRTRRRPHQNPRWSSFVSYCNIISTNTIISPSNQPNLTKLASQSQHHESD